jgi:GDPmannose 4,6-dehydratase
MWRMLQTDTAEDFVVATGEQHAVRDFCAAAFAEAGLPLEWRGSGLHEEGVSPSDGRVLVAVDPRYFRPTEVETLLGDASKAREKLGWAPRVGFAELVKMMVRADLETTRRLVEGIGAQGPVDSGKREG